MGIVSVSGFPASRRTVSVATAGNRRRRTGSWRCSTVRPVPPFWLLTIGSLNGEPGDEALCPGLVVALKFWHDWPGGPVPLGLLSAQAGTAALTKPIIAERNPIGAIRRMVASFGLPASLPAPPLTV